MAAPINIIDIIRRKRDGLALGPSEIAGFVGAYARGEIPDYQAAALLMAIFLRGMDGAELLALTESMLHSGDVIDLSDLPGKKIDKHSTGGVGDKISLPLAPAVAACGVLVPMISGRGLGHTGGTLDKLESIPGFSTTLTIEEFRAVIRECGLSLIGQTERLVPADKRLYALRDVTSTVESIPLIAASIMSKKLAEGIDGLVLDVKVGSGAFMKTLPQARLLAETLLDIGRRAGKQVTAFLTDMDQPLGRYVGNAAEVVESVEVLRGRGPEDLVELVRALGAEMLRLGGVDAGAGEAARRGRIDEAIRSGAALSRFACCARLQGARVDLADANEDLSRLLARPPREVHAPRAGFVWRIDAEAVGRAGVALGAGRRRKEDPIDQAAYIYLVKKRGEAVRAGEPLCRLAFSDGLPGDHLAEALALLTNAYEIGDERPQERPLILEVLRCS